MNTLDTSRKIGLVAGWGSYPIQVARRLNEQGYLVYCVGVYGHANPELRGICHDFRWFGMARMGAQIRYLRSHGITCATMAGKIFKTKLFERFAVIRHFPDLAVLRKFYSIMFNRDADRRDDTLLLAVTRLYADHGIMFAPATNFVPELLVQQGLLTKHSPTQSQIADVLFAWRVAKEIGRLDIGQSVAVKGRAVLAVEAVEGTDDCIRRAGQLCPSGGYTVAKVAKPQQDMRFDVPTIGIGTLKTMRDAGGAVLAIEAHKTIVLDSDELVEFANYHRIAVVSIRQDAIENNQIALAAA